MEIDLGNRIKGQIEIHGIKQKDLAEAINVSESAMSNYCNNHRIPDVFVCLNIAKYFGMTLDEFLGIPITSTQKRKNALLSELDEKLVDFSIEKLEALNRFLEIEISESKAKK